MSSTFRFFSSIFSFGCRFFFLSTRIGVALCRSFSITEHIPFRTVSNMCGCLSIIKMYAPLLEMKIAIVKWQRIHFFLADLSTKFLDYFFSFILNSPNRLDARHNMFILNKNAIISYSNSRS